LAGWVPATTPVFARAVARLPAYHASGRDKSRRVANSRRIDLF
jgi:hypothetical protein